MSETTPTHPSPTPCPKCRQRLLHIERSGQILEICSGCRGIWFDPGELTTTLELYKRLEADAGGGSGAFCIRCQDRELKELPFPGTGVLVDCCPGCQGVWLDDGELEVLRAHAETLIPASPDLAERARQILGEAETAGALRFSCPKCLKKLWHIERQGQVVEVCSGCGGTWFDGGELTLQLGVYRKVEAEEGKDVGIPCIRCGATLRELPYPETDVEVDACPDCRGIWLDQGELETLRAKLADLIPPDQGAYAERAATIFDDLDKGTTARAQCPKCEGRLEVNLEGSLRAERCVACEGTWLDSGDLTRALGVSRRIRTQDASPTEVRCIRCPAGTLVELPYPKTEVLIDVCPDCRGIWLDQGEVELLLAAVRG